MKICSIDDCDESAKARGWCSKHYARWQSRGGDPSFSKQGAPLRWLVTALKNRNRDECWDDWPFATTEGYPRVGKRAKRASHIALESEGFPRPDFPNDKALHSCDNRMCVNPDHLSWGSQQRNVDDIWVRLDYCKHCDHCN